MHKSTYAKQRYVHRNIYVGEKKSVASRAYVDSFYYIHTKSKPVLCSK